MKTPTWEPSPGSLAAWLLANLQAQPVDVWTITFLSGTVLRYTSGDQPITVNGNTFALGAGFKRSSVKQSIGVSVDTLTLTVSANSLVLVNGLPILLALAKGIFAGAVVQLERAFLDSAGTCQGLVGVFYGRVGGVKVTRSGATMEVRSHSELLDVMIPSEIYQPGCRNTLFDAQCGLAALTYTATGTTNAAGDSTSRILTSTSALVIAKPTGWADLGVLTITSGLNSGVSRTVRSHVLSAGVATITAVSPFPFSIASGVTFAVRAGCNKTKDGDCATKFNNLARFRGEPYIPAPETIT